MALVNRDNYPLQFERSITRMVKEAYAKYSSEYEKVARIMTAEKGRKWEMAQVTGLGAVREVPEGAGVEFDTPKEGHSHYIEYFKTGLGYQVTEEMAQDDVHGVMLPKLSQSLGEQHRYRQDLDFWRLFALGNGTSFRSAWDGGAAFKADHTTLKSGTIIDNIATDALSETSLQAAFQYFYTGLVSEEGIPLDINPDMLIVSKAKHFTAYQLLNQTTGVTALTADLPTNNNDMTTNPANGYVSPYKLMGSKILAQLVAATSGLSDCWFLVDSKKLEAFFLWKSKFKLESGDDFRTGNALFKGTQRYGVGWGDYKAAYGSFVA